MTGGGCCSAGEDRLQGDRMENSRPHRVSVDNRPRRSNTRDDKGGALHSNLSHFSQLNQALPCTQKYQGSLSVSVVHTQLSERWLDGVSMESCAWGLLRTSFIKVARSKM